MIFCLKLTYEVWSNNSYNSWIYKTIFTIYLLVIFYNVPIGNSALMPQFIPVFKTLLKSRFWYIVSLLQRFCFYFFNCQKLISFHFWKEKKKSHGAISGEYNKVVTVSLRCYFGAEFALRLYGAISKNCPS